MDLCEQFNITPNAFIRNTLESVVTDPYGMAIHSIATKDEQTAPRYGYIRALLKVANMYGQHLTEGEKDALRRAMEISSSIFSQQVADLVKEAEKV